MALLAHAHSWQAKWFIRVQKTNSSFTNVASLAGLFMPGLDMIQASAPSIAVLHSLDWLAALIDMNLCCLL